MAEDETPLRMAERHVREGEAWVAHQEEIAAELVRDGHDRAAVVADELLTTLRRTLELAREHMRIERERSGA